MLRQHKQDYPEVFAFQDVDTENEDTSLTRDERALEFELEKTIGRITEISRSRQAVYAAPGASVGLPAVGDIRGIREHRELRNAILDENSRVPQAEMPVDLSELLFKEVALSAEPKNTHAFLLSVLGGFYRKRLDNLPLQRYRLLFRWARHCGCSELMSRTDQLLRSRLLRLDEDYAHTTATLARIDSMRAHLEASAKESRDHAAAASREGALGAGTEAEPATPRSPEGGEEGGGGAAAAGAGAAGVPKAGGAGGVQGDPLLNGDRLGARDMWVWLNDTSYRNTCRRRFRRFATKCRWLAVGKRWELLGPICDSIVAPNAGGSSAPDTQGVPLLALTDEEVEPVLEELTSCFNLRSSSDDSQEHTYAVNKGFAAVFASQTQAMEFSPYDLPTKKKIAAQGRVREKTETAGDAEDDSTRRVCLVHSTWAQHEAPATRAPAYLDQIRSGMNFNQENVDGALKVEAKFLHETDSQYVVKRLLDQAANHVERAKVTSKEDEGTRGPPSKRGQANERFRAGGNATGGGANFSQTGTGGQGPSLAKRQALYLLRYIRVREFKRRLLDILNYFASIRRRLCLDMHGYGVSHGGEEKDFVASLHNQFDDKASTGQFAAENRPSFAEPEEAAEGGLDDFTQRVKQFTLNPDGHPHGSGVTAGPPPPLKSSQGDDDAHGGAGHQGGGRSMGSDGQTIFNLSSIENRDDTYKVSGKSISVIDRFGQTIMYDLALTELTALEAELLRLGTHYMGMHTAQSLQTPDIDRVAVLENLYECETWFHEGKRKIVDGYMEAYEHVSGSEEQAKLAQVIIDTIKARPVLDLQAGYFVNAYSEETILQELHHSLLRDVINAQITDEKRMTSTIYKSGSSDWWQHAGFPDITTSDTRLYQSLFPGSSVVNVLDFYQTMGVVAEIPEMLESVSLAVSKRFGAEPHVITAVKQKVLQQFLVEWKVLLEEERVQRQLQNAAINSDSDDKCLIDDAAAVSHLIHEIVLDHAVPMKKGEPKLDEKLIQSLWHDAAEAVLTRSALLDSLYETEVLYNIHRKQGMIMGVEVRKFQFECMDFETKKTTAEIDELSEVDVEMADVVAYRTEYLTSLAITEFERGMGQFDFHTSDGVKKILCFGVPDLRRSLTVQLTQKNMLITAALYNQVPIDSYFEKMTFERLKVPPTDAQGGAKPHSAEEVPSPAAADSSGGVHSRGKLNVSRFSAEVMQQQASADQALPTAGKRGRSRAKDEPFPPFIQKGFVTTEQLQAMFLSVNHIKSMHRKRIIDELNVRTTEVLRSKRLELLRKKMKELKHALIQEYCVSVMTAVGPYALKWQVARLSHDIKRQCSVVPGLEELLVIGAPDDALETVASGTGHTRTKGSHWEGTCLVALDGRIEEVRYIPHYVQVYELCTWAPPPAGNGQRGGRKPSASNTEMNHCTEVAYNVRALRHLASMAHVLHHLLSIIMYFKVQSKLHVTPAIAGEPRSGLDLVARDFKSMQTEMEVLNDLSDTTTVVSWLEQYHAILHLKLYLCASTVRQACLAPRGAKPLRSTAALIGVEVQALECVNKGAPVPPTFTSVMAASLLSAGALRGAEPSTCPYRTTWHLVSSHDVADAPPSEVPFDEGFFTVSSRPLWLGAESHPLEWTESFLLRAGDDDRSQLLAEQSNLSAYINEVKNDQAFVEEVIYEAKDRDHTLSMLRACMAALRIHAQRELLKTFYCGQLQRVIHAHEPSDDGRCDEAFVKMMHSKARAQYELDLQEQGDDAKGRSRRRNRTEIGLRCKQVAVLRQEINKALITMSISKAKQLLQVVNESAAAAASVDPDDAAPSRKLEIFSDFHNIIMTKGVAVRQEDSESLVYHIPADVLSLAMDQVGVSLREWQADHLRDISDVSATILLQHRHALFKAEQKLVQLERLRELDKKALSRRVAARVNDEKYTLIFQRNTLQKANEELTEKIRRLEAIVREEVKSEYEEVVAKLQGEISLLQGQFRDHKRKLYREMQINLEEIKRHAMMSIGKSEVAPLHMKRQALRIAINDEEANKLKEQNAELQMTVAKLNLWHEMKLSNLESHYQKKLIALGKEKDEASSRYWGNKEKVEEKEELMRQQLHATQKSLSATEMEVEQLLRDLDLQERKKKHLVTWKVAHSKQLEELTRRAKRYEKYEKYDVDRLLRSLEKGEDPTIPAKQPLTPTTQNQTLEQGSPQLQGTLGKEVGRLREELKREKRLKMKAFLKLDQLREDQEAVTDEMVWQKKYFECASELQRALRDLQTHRDYLGNLGLPAPNLQRAPDIASPPSSTRSKNLPDLEHAATPARPPTRPSAAPTHLHPRGGR